MGSNTSTSDDQQHLLQDTDDEPVLLFEKIKIVLIGHEKAGKNKIGNAILGKKAFTYWNTRAQEHYLKDDNTTFGRRITLIRVPGWSEVLSSEDHRQMSIRQVIKDSVKSFKDGPHAIILVVKTNNTLKETTRDTLEKLLGSNISEHTLVFSTDGKKILLATMNDHCAERNQMIIGRCRKRYHFLKRCTCGKQNMELIEAIENFIVKKNTTYFYPPGKEPPSPELQVEQLVTLVNRLNQKISAQTEYISKLQSDNQTNRLRRIIVLKNKEIQQLQDVLRHKEEALTEMRREVERLRANQSDPVSSVLHERISQLEDEGRRRENMLQRVTEQNKLLNEELEKKNAKIKTLEHENQELMNILFQKDRQRMQIQTRKTTRRNETESFELQQLPSAGAEFVDQHRTELIQRVLSVDSILDELKTLIGNDKYSKIRLAQTNQDKMRELYIILESGGLRLKEAFMKSLLKYEPCVVEDLTSK